jgi:hypothetical protein
VKNGEHNEPFRLNLKENRIWEAPHSHAPHVRMHDRKSLWVFGSQQHGAINLQYEF